MYYGLSDDANMQQQREHEEANQINSGAGEIFYGGLIFSFYSLRWWHLLT